MNFRLRGWGIYLRRVSVALLVVARCCAVPQTASEPSADTLAVRNTGKFVNGEYTNGFLGLHYTGPEGSTENSGLNKKPSARMALLLNIKTKNQLVIITSEEMPPDVSDCQQPIDSLLKQAQAPGSGNEVLYETSKATFGGKIFCRQLLLMHSGQKDVYAICAVGLVKKRALQFIFTASNRDWVEQAYRTMQSIRFD